MPRSVLFNEGSMDGLLFGYEKQLPQEIADLTGQRVLSASFSDLCSYFEKRYHLDVPTLKLEEAHALDPEDTKVPLSPHESQFFYDGQVREVPGTVFSLVVPFEGDADLFKYQPRSFHMNLIEGAVTRQGTALLLQHTQRDHDPRAARAEFDNRIGRIREYLDTHRQHVAPWNQRCRSW